ncbi:hypothetical protein CHU98_g7902 [Xylaria longipes]|nr:hypothetical protein CHU98_g7902 [Xylaria longipes]
MEVDPGILAVFGPPPAGIDLLAKQETAIIVVALISTAFATIALVLRVWARNFQRFGMMADDYLMVVALPKLVLVGMSGLYIRKKYHKSLKGSKWFHIRLGFAAFFTTGYLLSIWSVAAALCQPVEFFWTKFLGANGKCLDINASFLSLTVLNLVADLLVLVVPIPEILALQMSPKKKLGVCGVMLLGGLVCVVSAVRIWAFYQFTVEIDLTWVQANVFLLSSVEPAFGIVSACLPSLRPLYRRARAKITGKESHGSSAGTWYATSKASRIGNSYVRFGDDTSRSGERDDIALTRIGKGPNTNKPIPQNIILVRSEITQSSSNQPPRQNNSLDSY